MLFGGKTLESINITSPLQLIISVFIIFFIQSWLVQWSYNTIFPLLIYNTTGYNNNNFKPLTYTESIIVVILFTNLF